MKVKGYVILKRWQEEPDVHGDIYTKETYESVKKQIEAMKGDHVSDNFDWTLPPAGRILEVEEDEKGVLITVEVAEGKRPKGIGIGGTRKIFEKQIASLELWELTVTDSPIPGCETMEEEE